MTDPVTRDLAPARRRRPRVPGPLGAEPLATLVRFALFLLIPLGSWLGGAMVERAVDLVLD